ncbi:MAG: hypothetical protein QW144_03070, partial [Candidatus Micrarchaeaceae archaeon]
MSKLAIVFAALLALLLINIAKPQCPVTFTSPPQCSATFKAAPINTSILSLSLIALELSFDVVAIGYIIGRFFPGTGIHGWLRNEYWEIAKSAMIIAAIIPILVFLSNIAVALYGIPPSTSYVFNIGTLVSATEHNYLCCAFGTAEQGNNYLTGLGLAIGIYKDLKIGLWIPLPLPPLAPIVVVQSGFQISPYQNSMLESTVLTGQYESLARDALAYVVAPSTLLL